jgi:hypothetical protein
MLTHPLFVVFMRGMTWHGMAWHGMAWEQIGEEAQQSVIRKVFQQVAQRPDSFCNYLEGR